MNYHICFAILAFSTLARSQCLYDKCPTSYEPEKLHVHVVCHSHCDMGWLKNVEQYYWGANQSIYNAGVQYILNTVYSELLRDPGRRFVWAEIGFFIRWWQEQDEKIRDNLRQLVNEGRLEFINGGWVSHDEATTHYVAMIDQMTLGHRFLNDNFGTCGRPVVGWQIDPFGHSRENVNLYRMMGIDSMFFARIHWIDRNDRLLSKNMEFNWQTSDDDPSSQMFTNVFPVHYSPPYGFSFGSGDVVVDKKSSSAYNLDLKLDEFVDTVRGWSDHYRSNHVIVTMGDDFQYQDANKWFTNLDKVIKAINGGTSKAGNSVKLHYSTPSCYYKAVTESNTSLTWKKDDLFPYADSKHVYWTGYFTSRPTLKGYVRMANNLLQVCKQLSAFSNLGESQQLYTLPAAEATLQHHDAVAGTAKQHVTDDYAKQISDGIASCESTLTTVTSKITRRPTQASFCLYLNVSQCEVPTSSSVFTVTAFSGISRTNAAKLRIPVGSGRYKVVDSDGNEVEFDMKKVYPTTQMPYHTISPFELLIPMLLPPLGFTIFTVEKVSERTFGTGEAGHRGGQERSQGPITIENEFLSATFGQDGKLSSVTSKSTGVTTSLAQDLFYYTPSITNNRTSHVSGAYIFRPKSSQVTQIGKQATVRVLRGKYYQEVWQSFSSWASQVVRLTKGKPYLEIEWTVGPVPVGTDPFSADTYGKEVISRFDTDIDSGDCFYTDANGRQMMERRRNFQETYTWDNAEPVAGNYFPVNTRIAIKDGEKQLTVLTDRSQGGSSLRSGSIELMLHRRLTADDDKGVGEALNEMGPNGKGLVARGVHRVIFSDLTSAAALHRTQADEMFSQPVLMFEEGRRTKGRFAGLTRDLPPNVKIVTLDQWKEGTILLRLEHTFQKGEDELSQPVTLDLKGLFSTFKIRKLTETTLTGNRDASTQTDLTIVLKPMQIRTFRCLVDWNN